MIRPVERSRMHLLIQISAVFHDVLLTIAGLVIHRPRPASPIPILVFFSGKSHG